jgi:TonB family protein
MKPVKFYSTILFIAYLITSAFIAKSQTQGNSQQKMPVEIRQSMEVLQKSVTYQVEPEYPQEAKAQGISGSVVLEVRIDEAGNVISVTPVSGQQLLVNVAMKAVKAWKFAPTKLSGVAAQVRGNVAFYFTADGKVSNGNSEDADNKSAPQPPVTLKTADTALPTLSEKEANDLFQKLQDAYDIPIRINNPDGIVVEITKATIRVVKRDEQNYAMSDATTYATNYAIQVAISVYNRTDKKVSGINLKFTNKQLQHIFYARANMIEMKPQEIQQIQINLMTIAGDPTELQVEVAGVLYSSGKSVGVFPNLSKALYAELRVPAVVNPQVDTKPRPLNRFSPSYTSRARLNGISGIIRLLVEVGIDGSTKKVQVVNALPDGLTDEAIRIAKVLQFKPAMAGAQPVDYTIVLEMEFYRP